MGDRATGLPLEISIHAPARGGDHILGYEYRYVVISIHAPARGGDMAEQDGGVETNVFQSTPPRGGATAKMHSFTCGSLTNK